MFCSFPVFIFIFCWVFLCMSFILVRLQLPLAPNQTFHLNSASFSRFLSLAPFSRLARCHSFTHCEKSPWLSLGCFFFFSMSCEPTAEKKKKTRCSCLNIQSKYSVKRVQLNLGFVSIMQLFKVN